MIVLGKVDITTETSLSNNFGVSHFVRFLNNFCFILLLPSYLLILFLSWLHIMIFFQLLPLF